MTPRLALLGLLLSLSCTDAAPCTSCPPIEGVWFLQYTEPTFPCDAGTPTTPPATVSFTREGSVMRGAIEGVTLSGTLYDTYDFTLAGQSMNGDLTVNLRGLYIAPDKPDAGSDRITSGTLARSTASCRDERRFTGARY